MFDILYVIYGVHPTGAHVLLFHWCRSREAGIRYARKENDHFQTGLTDFFAEPYVLSKHEIDLNESIRTKRIDLNESI